MPNTEEQLAQSDHDPLAFIYSGAPQRSPDWLAIKRGRIGASRLSDWLSVSKAKNSMGKPLQKRLDYEKELMFERMFGVSFSVFVNDAMQEGIDFEQYAADEYARLNNVVLEEVGCWYNDYIAVSPDRQIVNDGDLLKCVDCGKITTSTEAELRNFNTNRCAHCNGELVDNIRAGIEIKIVKDNTFTAILVEGVPDKHYKQIQGQLWATGWEWIDYVALNFNTKKFVVIRVKRDEELIDYMKLSVQEQLVVTEFEFADQVYDIQQKLPEHVEFGAAIDHSDSNVKGWA